MKNRKIIGLFTKKEYDILGWGILLGYLLCSLGVTVWLFINGVFT
jgi:hypothetical protein